jgi:HK97 family phage prohead protease
VTSLTHEKVGHTGKGLWGHKDWQLPAYIQHVANDLIKSGHDESRAIEMAVGIVRNWAEGHNGKGGKVSAETQAKAVKAMAEWESLKAATKAKTGGSHRMTTVYTRSFALEDISVTRGGDGRTVDAYAAIFNSPAKVRDQDGEYEEVIDPVAFNRAIEHAQRAKGGWNVPVIFNHGMTLFGTPSPQDSVPIGTAEEIRADPRGLFTRTRYHRSQRADDVLEAIREGSITAYSFTGEFHRSDPLVPRGGFRPDHTGKLKTVRRTESSLREFGPTPFPVYSGAEVVGMRAEQVAVMLGNLPPDEFERLSIMFRSGTLDDPPEPGTPDDSGPVAGDPPPTAESLWHSARSPKQIILANRGRFITRHGGANDVPGH